MMMGWEIKSYFVVLALAVLLGFALRYLAGG